MSIIHLLCRRLVAAIIDGVAIHRGRAPSEVVHCEDGSAVIVWSGAAMDVSFVIDANGAFRSRVTVDGGAPLFMTVASAQTIPAGMCGTIAKAFPNVAHVAVAP